MGGEGCGGCLSLGRRRDCGVEVISILVQDSKMVTNGLNWALQGAAKVPVLVNKIGVVHENEVDVDTVHFGTDLEFGQDGQERGRLPFGEAEGMRATTATTRSL